MSKVFKIRCSEIGKIMTEPKNKIDKEKGNLSQTAKAYCDKWLLEQLYNREKEFSSKYTEKGNIVEDNGLDLIAEMLDIPFLMKNQIQYENEYITGTPDTIYEGIIIDNKSSWDFSTFPLLADELPNKDYYWQMQGYLDLDGSAKVAKVCYTLIDTPLHLIEKEFRNYCFNTGYDGVTDVELYDKFIAKHTYSDIPKSRRFKSFDIQRNHEDIKRIYSKVAKCRKYINDKLTDL